MARPTSRIKAGKPTAPRLVTWFMLLAFAVQGYLVQTHIHGQPVQAHTASAPARPAPSDPFDPANCPLCQEMLHAGAAITPDLPQALVLLSWIATAQAVSLLPAPAFAPQPGWQSRGPPRF